MIGHEEGIEDRATGNADKRTEKNQERGSLLCKQPQVTQRGFEYSGKVEAMLERRKRRVAGITQASRWRGRTIGQPGWNV